MEQSSQEPAALDLRMISNAAIQVIITSSLGKLVQYGALIVVLVDLIKEGEKPTKEKLPYSSPMNMSNMNLLCSSYSQVFFVLELLVLVYYKLSDQMVWYRCIGKKTCSNHPGASTHPVQ
jgi:hypothetical protein